MNSRNERMTREADVPQRTLAMAVAIAFLVVAAAALANGDEAPGPDVAAIVVMAGK
jgi:hypothetical protein